MSEELTQEDVEALRELLLEELSGLSEEDRRLIPEELPIVRQILLARKLRRRLRAVAAKAKEKEKEKEAQPGSRFTVRDLIELGRQIAKERERQREPEGWMPEAWR